MEGRPPFDDPDDELDFDFEASRRRRLERETGERDIVEPPSGEGPAAEPPPEELDEGTGAPARRRGPRIGGLKLPRGIGPGRRRGRRRPEARERAASAPDTGERAAPGSKAGERDALTETGEQRRLRDDPYTPAEVPVPAVRRSRRRDLPANVRRRQAIALGVAAVVVLGGGYALASSLFGGDDEEEPLALKKLIGQSVVGAVGKEGPDQQLLRRVRKGQLGGVIVAPRNETTLTADVQALQQAAAEGENPPLLVMIDQEGGDVKRLPGPPNASPAELGRDGDANAARAEGEATGQYLKPLGVNVDLAPVLDVEFPQTAETIADRTFGDEASVVSELGSGFIEGLQAQGVAATAKHFPGLGPATINTDFSPVTIAARTEQLEAGLQPFQAAVDAGVDLVMVSSAIYPSYGPEKPAAFAKPVVQAMLREQMGFEGVAVTDDLQSIAIEELSSPAIAGVAAIGAGMDLILYARNPRGSQQGFNAVVKAAKDEKITRERLQESYDRVLELKREVAATG